MRLEEAYRKLPEYLDGGLSAAERSEMELLLRDQPELQDALALSEQLEESLRDHRWLVPSPDFTVNVLSHIEAAPESASPGWLVMWERAKMVLSAAALLVTLILYGKTLFLWSNDILSGAGNWLEILTGYSLFALHPVIILGLLAPLLAGGYATCVLTGRCKLSA